jgi:DNA-binding PadR family transcriptional regulator
MKPSKRHRKVIDISTGNIKLPYAICIVLKGNHFTLDELDAELNRQKPGKWTRGQVVGALHSLEKEGKVVSKRSEQSLPPKRKGEKPRTRHDHRFSLAPEPPA